MTDIPMFKTETGGRRPDGRRHKTKAEKLTFLNSEINFALFATFCGKTNPAAKGKS